MPARETDASDALAPRWPAHASSREPKEAATDWDASATAGARALRDAVASATKAALAPRWFDAPLDAPAAKDAAGTPGRTCANLQRGPRSHRRFCAKWAHIVTTTLGAVVERDDAACIDAIPPTEGGAGSRIMRPSLSKATARVRSRHADGASNVPSGVVSSPSPVAVAVRGFGGGPTRTTTPGRYVWNSPARPPSTVCGE
mmetsp:Transcript_26321/g.81316  ORF Transcript_26321/g.81316 Transcript_26321/m.81316 type:complete len:201 (+) Transcript_26321:716-1318(+)